MATRAKGIYAAHCEEQQDAFWMKLGAEKRLAAYAKRSLIPSAFNLLAPILSMPYRRDGFLGTY